MAEGERVASEAKAAAAAAADETARAERSEREAFALSYKEMGNSAFREGRFGEASAFYSQAIDLDASSAVLFSNRSGGRRQLN